MDSLYNALIVEHDRAPRNEGPLPGATHAATVDNPMCGDTVTMRAIVIGQRIAELTFEARGCALCRAASSLLTLQLAGTSVNEVTALAAAFEAFITADAPPDRDLGDLVALRGVKHVRSRRACALLPFRAIATALSPLLVG